MNNLCFVLMPFGKKPDVSGRTIDFDAVYRDILKPAIAAAGLEAIRADEELQGGIIHKPMFERLVLCAYAIADLTSANANVFYELGVRHAVRPWRTVSIFAEGSRLPFDVSYLRSYPYRLDASGVPSDPDGSRKALAAALVAARQEAKNPSVDSPVFQLLGYLTPPAVDHEKTDLFRKQSQYSADVKAELAAARAERSSPAIEAVLAKQPPLAEVEVGVAIDAMLSYRAVKAWDRMINFIGEMPAPLAETVMVQEQLAFALNRAGRGGDSERVLLAVLKQHGQAPETLGLLGRVYKDRWHKASGDGATSTEESNALLDSAIDAYRRGFEADWRDAYPGVNAVTLMEVRGATADSRALLPIVRYAVERKMTLRGADYWDHATLLELAIVEQDAAAASAHLGRALAAVREDWEPETTANNLAILRRSRASRSVAVEVATRTEVALRRKAKLPEQVP